MTNATKSPGLAIASLILGIGAMFFALIPFVGFASVPFAIVGLALGVAGINRARRGFEGMGLAVTGLVTSLISLAITAVFALFISAGVNAVVEEVNRYGPAPDDFYELKLVSCNSDSTGGDAEFSIRNLDDESHTFGVTVDFLDGGRILDDGWGSSGSLAPDETGTIYVASYADIPPGVSCEASEVEMLGS